MHRRTLAVGIACSAVVLLHPLCAALFASETVLDETQAGRFDRCGANALSVCCRRLGVPTSVETLDASAGHRGDQTTLLDLQRAARENGLYSVGLNWSGSVPAHVLTDAPGILPLTLPGARRHFVAVVASDESRLLIVDFPDGILWVPAHELRRNARWDGTILHIARDPETAQDIASRAHAGSVGRWLLWVVCGGAAVVAALAVLTSSRRRKSQPPPGDAGLLMAERSGFSSLELLTVLGILSLLLAIVLPAVQSAREAARRSICVNRLRQIGVAAESFETVHQRYPGGSVRSNLNTGNISPHVELLPYLDQTALFQQFDRAEQGSGLAFDPPTSSLNQELLDVELPAFVCPDDPAPGPKCNYRISNGTTPWLHETTPRGPGAALLGYRTLLGRRDAEFRDGKSQTAAFSEKLSGDRNPDEFSPWRDLLSILAPSPGLATPDDAAAACARPAAVDPVHFSFGGSTWALSGYPTTWYNHVLTPNSSVPDCVHSNTPEGHGAFTARSLHPGGVNTLFADGAVHFVAESIDLSVWRAAGSAAGGESVSIDF